MSAESITARPHNEYVGSAATNARRIPGADKATTGNHYEALFPKEGGERRPQEHLPAPTGRDAPPAPASKHAAHTAPTELRSDILDAHRARDAASPLRPITHNVQPQPPAPGSEVVVDRDPYATPPAAGDTLTGATSGDVHQGLGHPGAGMTSKELRHDGKPHRKSERGGADQYGGNEVNRDVNLDL